MTRLPLGRAHASIQRSHTQAVVQGGGHFATAADPDGRPLHVAACSFDAVGARAVVCAGCTPCRAWSRLSLRRL